MEPTTWLSFGVGDLRMHCSQRVTLSIDASTLPSLRWVFLEPNMFMLRAYHCKHSVNPVGGKIANELSGHAPDFPLVSVW